MHVLSNWCVGSLAALAGGLALSPVCFAAGADSPKVVAALEWSVESGVSGCATGVHFAGLAAERMGRPLFAAHGERSTLTVSARIEPRGDGLVATVELMDASGVRLGRRELTSEDSSCEGLIESLALVVGMMLDYAPSAEEIEEAPIRVPPRSEWELRVGGVGEAGFGLAPAASWGGGVAVNVVSPTFWALDVEALLYGPTSLPGTDQRLSIRSLRVAACGLRVSSGKFRGQLCIGQQTALLDVEDTAFPRGRKQSAVSAAFGPRVRLEAALVGPFWLSLFGGLEFPVSDVTFTDLGVQSQPIETHRNAGVLGYASLGLGVNLF